MAEVTFVSADVVNFVGDNRQCGEALTPGDFVYEDPADLLVKKGDNSTAIKANIIGMAMNATSASGQPVAIVSAGDITVSSTDKLGNIGHLFSLSPTAGKMEDTDATSPAADEFVTQLGVSLTSDILRLNIKALGLAKVA